MTDLFDELIAAQREYQARLSHAIGYHPEHEFNPTDFNDEFMDPYTRKRVTRGVQPIIDNADMLAAEALEVKDVMPWKKHKRNFGAGDEWDLDEAQEEVIDCLHFVINLLDLVGLDTSDQIREAFFKKHQVNHDRQTEGY